MKKRKIRKGIILVSMVMVIISTVMPVTSSAASDVRYERGEVLYVLENPTGNSINSNTGNTIEIREYILNNTETLTQDGFYYITVLHNGIEYEMTEWEPQSNFGYLISPATSTTEQRELSVQYDTLLMSFRGENFEILEELGVKITIYEIIKIDVKKENLLGETTNGIGTVLTWVKSLWDGITTGQMKAILPIFAIFVIIPIILLVIKIVRKVVWGD